MRAKKVKISEAEWVIMKILWKGNPENGFTLGDIVKELGSDNKWSYTTIRTLIVRLINKDVIKADTNTGVYRYFANISKEQCVKDELNSFITRIFDDSPSKFIATLINDVELDDAEKDEIYKLLSDLKDKEN
jgi:Predicted transcriptional regulator